MAYITGEGQLLDLYWGSNHGLNPNADPTIDPL